MTAAGAASFTSPPTLLHGPLPSSITGRESSLVGKLLPGSREGSILGGGNSGSSRQNTFIGRPADQQPSERQQPPPPPQESGSVPALPKVMRIKMFILRTSSSHTIPLASPRAPSAVGELDLDSDIAGAMGEVGEAAARRLREIIDAAAMHRRRDDLWHKLNQLPAYSGTLPSPQPEK